MRLESKLITNRVFVDFWFGFEPSRWRPCSPCQNENKSVISNYSQTGHCDIDISSLIIIFWKLNKNKNVADNVVNLLLIHVFPIVVNNSCMTFSNYIPYIHGYTPKWQNYPFIKFDFQKTSSFSLGYTPKPIFS